MSVASLLADVIEDNADVTCDTDDARDVNGDKSADDGTCDGIDDTGELNGTGSVNTGDVKDGTGDVIVIIGDFAGDTVEVNDTVITDGASDGSDTGDVSVGRGETAAGLGNSGFGGVSTLGKFLLEV